MAKLTLKIDPEFKVVVDIPRAGGDPVQIKLTCKHRTKDELASFVKSRAEKQDVESIKEMATAWDLEDEFNEENISLLCQNYITAPVEIYRKYIEELVKAKEKN
jgi:hypothetical protein